MPRRTGTILVVAVGLLAAAGLALLVFGTQTRRADPDDAKMVALGHAVYVDHCAECHGKALEGEPNWRTAKADGTLPAPPHDASGHTWHHGDELLFRYTKEGGAAVAPPGFRSAMPGFGDVLTDEQIWAALAYIKSQWPEPVRQRQAQMNR